MTPIRIMIVDDQDLVRRGLRLFFEVFGDIELVAEAVDGRQAIELCDELQPDVVLMDLMMPEMNGIAATKIIRQKHPHIQVIALTNLQDDATVHQMLNAGASAYLLKSASVEELTNTIISAAKVAHASK